MNHKRVLIMALVMLALLIPTSIVTAQGPKPSGGKAPNGGLTTTAFIYQGQLKQNASAVNGNCDFQFTLYDAAIGVNVVGTTPPPVAATVSSGLFTAQVDFGVSAFNGDPRWLDIQARCPAGGGAFTPLTPRQQLMPAPMAFALPGLYTQQNGSSPNIIGGYSGNTVTSGVVGATISGGGANGSLNRVTDDYGTVGGGNWNQAGDGTSTTTSSYYATVGGGSNNLASGQYTTIGGGNGNEIDGYSATIGGGNSNYVSASGNYATVGGGNGNIASGTGSFIGGGGTNGTTDLGNQALGTSSTIGGGVGNVITGTGSFIGGGGTDGTNANGNQINGTASTIGGGLGNNITGADSVIGGGYFNSATANYATVPGGYNNSANGHFSFAAGYKAQAVNQGAFVWADSTGGSNFLSSTADNQFLVRASGGITMYTNSSLSNGVRVMPGSGTWSNVSDRNTKANFADVNSQAILARVMALPIQTWNYKTQDASIRHIGPMAQDFYSAFNIGEDDTHITTIDSEGVALAAIQGLDQVMQQKDAEIASLTTQVTTLKSTSDTQQNKIDDLNARLSALEQLTQANNGGTHSDNTGNVAMMVIGALLGVVIVRQPWSGGKR